MRTVGEILSGAREKQCLTILAVAEATKIRPKFIRAIEKNDFTKLPSAITAYGFIKNYAQFLKISPNFVLAVFRRDFDQDQKGKIIPRGLVKPLDIPKLYFSFRSGLFLLTVTFIIGLLVYLFFQYFSLIRGPFLQLISPIGDIRTIATSIEVVGRTEPDATVKINNQSINISPKGEFQTQVNLSQGKNTIIVQASNKLGKTKILIREVIKE